MLDALRELRKKEGLTQEEMAAVMAVSYSMYKKVEAGDRLASAGFIRKFKSKWPNVSCDLFFIAQPKPHKSNFCEKLGYLRRIRGETQEQTAINLNKNPSTYRMWELGLSEPKLADLVSLADYFHVSLDTLLCRKKEAEDE